MEPTCQLFIHPCVQSCVHLPGATAVSSSESTGRDLSQPCFSMPGCKAGIITHLETGTPELIRTGLKASSTQSQGCSLSNVRDQWNMGPPYLLPPVETVCFYDHVHQVDVVAAGGHCQGGFSLLQVRGRGKTEFLQEGCSVASACELMLSPAPFFR